MVPRKRAENTKPTPPSAGTDNKSEKELICSHWKTIKYHVSTVFNSPARWQASIATTHGVMACTTRHGVVEGAGARCGEYRGFAPRLDFADACGATDCRGQTYRTE